MANNPLDYLIQNPDAMRYALLQDASYKGGGAVVKMAEAGSVTKALEALRKAGQGASKAEQANAAAMRQFKQMVTREAPEQYKTITDAMRQSAQTGLEHSVVGNTNSGGESFITRGTRTSVVPNASDTRIALQAAGSPNIIDFHTHPGGYTAFGVEPSPKDLASYSEQYRRMAKDRELRTLIAIPPERVEFLSQHTERPRTAYNLFATNDPSVLSAKTVDDMRYELQRAGGRGAFDAVRSDPRFESYFEHGGNIGDTLGDASALLMQRYRALQGKGRHELQLSGAPIDSSGEVSNAALFDALLNPAMQVLEGKKFAEGGAVHMEEGGRPPLRSLDEAPTMDQIRFELSQMANQRVVPTVDPAEVANNARYIAERQTPVDLSAPLPDMSAQFGVNAKPASQAYTQYEVPRVSESGGIAPLHTVYDDRMEELNKQLDRGAKPDWMSDSDFAQSQVDRGRGGGNIAKALGSILSIPDHVTGSSMGLDPMLGLVGKIGELHGIPKAGRYMASRAAPFAKSTAEMANELYASGQMRGMVRPNAYMAEPKPEVPADIRAQLEEFKRKAAYNEQLRHEYLKQYHQAELADIPPYEDWLKQTGKQKMAEGVTSKTLSKAEREANLTRYTEESSVKEPLYHGTVFIDESGQPFRVPNTSTGTEKLGFHVGTPEQANQRVLLTPDPDVYQPNAHLMPLYVNSKNPLRVTDDEANDASQLVKRLLVENKITPAQYKDFKAKSARDDKPEKHAVELIKNLGHDSLVYSNDVEGAGDSYVLFNPHQVKSATGNVGTYDIKNPDMGHARGGSVKKPFTSPKHSGYNNTDYMRYELSRQG